MNTSPFSLLPAAKPDPIFSILAEAIACGKEGINCTAGVLTDEDGQVSLLPSVAKAIADISRKLTIQRFGYPPLLGLATYQASVHRLLFGEMHPWHVSSIATTGGTGALAVNLRLMKSLLKSGRLLLPTPAWANHEPPALAANLEVVSVPYLEDGIASVTALLEQIRNENGDFGILLQVGCHNPTGLDLTDDQWGELLDVLKGKNCVVLLDSAYQGLKDKPEKDREPIDRFLQAGIPILITWSAAKNHSIYALRTGLACAVLPSADLIASIDGHYSRITRQIHSASATIGQMVVARTQEAYQEEWRADLRTARASVAHKRSLMQESLPELFRSSLKGFGMFALLPLSVDQIRRLKNEHKVFMTEDGRINIAGIPNARIKEFCEKVGRVL